MLSITHTNQIPEYIKSIERQKDMLCVAQGFTLQDITDMIAIYDNLILTVENIMQRENSGADVSEIEVFNPETVK